MNQLYFDRSSVRGISENLHYRLEGYRERIEEIVALFGGEGGAASASDLGPSSGNKLLGSTEHDYHGRELGESLERHKQRWIPWLNDGLIFSLDSMSTALAVADEDITDADHDGADALADEFGDHVMFPLSNGHIGSR